MYIVTIENNGVATEIHGEIEKLKSGKVVKGINSIDSFSFSLLPNSPGWNAINDFTTLVKVYNTNKKRYEFYGRVLYSDTTMAESGLITKDVTCESYFGFLCDSQQTVVGERNWTVRGLLQYIIDYHNSQVEEYKQFTVGEVTVTDPNNNLYKGIQYENTWDTLKDKLIDTLGGEIRFRVVNGVNYIDYLEKIGKTSETEIAVSRNMKSIKQEKDPSAYITRLIPLGMKMGENDERLTIAEVNNGKIYIDDADGMARYGVHVGYQFWDDVTVASNLLTKGRSWLEANNKLKIKYSITALDLSLLGLDIDDFDVCNYHPLKNPLLGIDDVARITKKSIDVCEEIKSTIEVGENFKTATDIQIDQQIQVKKTYSQILKTDEEIRLSVKNEVERLESSISTTLEGITLTVTNNKNGTSSYFVLKSGETVLSSGNISFDGYVTFTGLADGTTTIDGGCIKTGTILADLIKAGVLQSDDGETFKLDLDRGTFSMKGSGQFQSPDGKTYIEIEGDEMVMYAFDEKSGEYFDKIHFGFITGSNPAASGGTLDYPYMLLGNAGGNAVGMIKEFYNGLWLGNSVPKDASGNFEGMAGASGIFVNTRTATTYVVNGTDMQNIYTGAAIAKFK